MAKETVTLVCCEPSLVHGEHHKRLSKVQVPKNEAKIMIASNRWALEGSEAAQEAAEKEAKENQKPEQKAKTNSR